MAATSLPGVLGGGGRRGLPAQFAHSVVPIAVGYAGAHYFVRFVLGGQETLALVSDPFGSGANLFGTTGFRPDAAILSLTTVAIVQVLGVVGGHIVAVVAARDRAMRVFPARHSVAPQLSLFVVMLTFTVGGLARLLA